MQRSEREIRSFVDRKKMEIRELECEKMRQMKRIKSKKGLVTVEEKLKRWECI